jgi:hypothetical protein
MVMFVINPCKLSECKVKFPSLNNGTARKLECKMFGLQSIRDSLSMLME